MSLFSDFQPLAAIATTPNVAEKLQPLCQTSGATLWVPPALGELENVQPYEGSLKEHVASLWHQHHAFVFGLASGAVVRLIAPLLGDKSRDPAVVVVDEKGQFTISLCGGHQGGADQLAQLIAQQIGATPVLTGASTGWGLPGVDRLGVPFGWCRGEGDWTAVSAAVARGEPVEVIQEAGSTLWQAHLPEGHPLRIQNRRAGRSPSIEEFRVQNEARIWISPAKREFSPESDFSSVQWHPRVLWIGIGCERGTSQQLMEAAIGEICQRYHLAEEAIAGMATVECKADEVGIMELCCRRNLPLKTFPAEVLRLVDVPTPSTVVNQEMGTPSVAESAALCAADWVRDDAGTRGQGHGWRSNSPPRDVCSGDAERGRAEEDKLATYNLQLLVPKQIFKREGQSGAVTIAIAQSQQEYTGRTGQLFLVGTGPGELDQMTPAARTAVTEADAVIGYSRYLDLIISLRRPGQIVEAFPITQERQRSRRAIDLAQWGLYVAVVSSGDSGIYGMAGLVFEELQAQGWDGQTPQVQVFAGITAMQAAAARVGAPLMHDFCAISLSDLLTPWEIIEKRLEAAAQADFITAIYNPRSRTRTEQIVTAQKLFLKHRHPNTPVTIVRSVYREDEQLTLTTLENMLQVPIDMLATVIIGNSSTRNYANWMLTPRGYLGFDAEASSETKD